LGGKNIKANPWKENPRLLAALQRHTPEQKRGKGDFGGLSEEFNTGVGKKKEIKDLRRSPGQRW